MGDARHSPFCGVQPSAALRRSCKVESNRRNDNQAYEQGTPNLYEPDHWRSIAEVLRVSHR